MTWTCHFITEADATALGADGLLRPGHMWYEPGLLGYSVGNPRRPATNYFRDNAHRAPIVVYLPGRIEFHVDGPALREGIPVGVGWEVSGNPPRLTVAPSIDIAGIYHGHLIDGVLSDDLAGRKYANDGRLAPP